MKGKKIASNLMTVLTLTISAASAYAQASVNPMTGNTGTINTPGTNNNNNNAPIGGGRVTNNSMNRDPAQAEAPSKTYPNSAVKSGRKNRNAIDQERNIDQVPASRP